MQVGVMEIAGVKVIMDKCYHGPEFKMTLEAQSLGEASADLRMRLMEFVLGNIQGQCLQDLSKSDLITIFCMIKNEMESRGLYP